MPDRKFGRIRPETLPHFDPRIPRFGAYLKPKLKPPPAARSWVRPWPGIMGDNDKIGSCGPTSLANILKCQSANALANPIILSTADIVSFYTLVSGYDPTRTNPRTGNNPTDTGVVMSDMLTAAQVEGIGGHKILGFAAVNPQEPDHVKWASIIGCGLLLGWNLPQSAEIQTEHNQPWTYIPGSPIVGGHATAAYGYVAGGPPIESWSEQIQADWNLFIRDVEECFLVVTDSVINSQQVGPAGLDLAAMMSDVTWFAKNS